jgi:hypothetical protein
MHDKPLIGKLGASFTDEFGVEIIYSARCLV